MQANIMRSQLLNFPEIQKGLTLRGVVLRSVHDNRESDYFKNVCFCVFVLFHLSSIFNLKTSEVKIPFTICCLLCYFHGNILSLHKELWILKLRIQKSTW